AASVGEPFEDISDSSAVDGADAEPADRSGDVKQHQRVGIGIEEPGGPNENAGDTDHHARAAPLDQISVQRHQPSLHAYEGRERPLDGVAAPMIFLIDGIDERRPTELEIGHHHHADDSEYKLPPTLSRGCGDSDVGCAYCCHGSSLPLLVLVIFY